GGGRCGTGSQRRFPGRCPTNASPPIIHSSDADGLPFYCVAGVAQNVPVTTKPPFCEPTAGESVKLEALIGTFLVGLAAMSTMVVTAPTTVTPRAMSVTRFAVLTLLRSVFNSASVFFPLAS